jgi:protein phosphatase
MQDHVVVDLQHDDPTEGDVYVLCSDGLSGMVNDEDIKQIVTSTGDIREACRRLIQRANERGGEDNITAVLIKIEEVEEEHAALDSTESGKRESGPRRPAANGKTGTSGG